MTYQLSSETEVALRRTAKAFRQAAQNPAVTTLHPKWVEGFTDGLKFASAALDELASGNPSADALAAAMRSLA